jgi:phage shock protein E
MDWTVLILAALLLVGFYTLKRASFVSASVARQQLQAGALVVDVRSPGEFQGGHLPNALNIPLGRLSEELPRRVPDKSQGLLLHCHSGTRSAIARRQALRLGYSNVFNLGSYGRAESLVRPSPGP